MSLTLKRKAIVTLRPQHEVHAECIRLLRQAGYEGEQVRIYVPAGVADEQASLRARLEQQLREGVDPKTAARRLGVSRATVWRVRSKLRDSTG